MGRALIALCVGVVGVSCKPAPLPCSADLSLDSFNCGECGNICAPGARCENGRCVATCTGLKCGGDVCVDPMTDPMNCGACGVACRPEHAAPACIAGACSHGPCEPGWFDCDRDAENGCESHDYLCLVEVCGRHDGGRPRFCVARSVSADGRRVLFTSTETDYLPGDNDPYTEDAFLFDVSTRRYRRIFAAAPTEVIFAAALSGDGTRAVVASSGSSQSASVIDVETGHVFVAPDLPDSGQPLPVYGQFSFSHDGQLISRGLVQYGGAETYGFVQGLPDGPTQRVESMFAVQLSGSGQVLGVVLDGGTGAPGEPYRVARDGGTPRLAGKRAMVPDDPGFTFQTRPPVLSFDGTVAAFETDRVGYEPPEEDAGRSNRIVVVGDDGGTLRVLLGFSPSLSYDGRRLGYSPLNYREPGMSGCVVIDVVSGERLFASQEVLPTMNSRYCVPRVSGDGRWVLLQFDFSGQPAFLVRLP